MDETTERVCPTCKGEGKTIQRHRLFFRPFDVETSCRECRGTGKLKLTLTQKLLGHCEIVKPTVN